MNSMHTAKKCKTHHWKQEVHELSFVTHTPMSLDALYGTETQWFMTNTTKAKEISIVKVKKMPGHHSQSVALQNLRNTNERVLM